jgi:multicomponent Na+:H+ antiporter subunit D
MDWLVPLPVLLPLFTAAILPLLGKLAPRRQVLDLAAILCSAAVVAADLLIVLRAAHAPQIYWFGGWSFSSGFPIGILFVVDSIGALTATLAALLALAGFIFSARYFEAFGVYFHILMLLFLAALTGFAFTADLFNLFVFFELMGVAAYALTGYKIEEVGPLEGGFNFAVMNSVGGIAMLAGIGLVYGRTGALTMAECGARMAAGGLDLLVMLSLALIFTGFFVKSALLPFHFWLPDAHAVAPTAVSVLLSGVMVEIGLLGAARVYWGVFARTLQPVQEQVSLLLVCLGGATALVGAVMALAQRHLKRLLAFSTISHSGLIACGLGFFSSNGITGFVLYLLGHGLLKGTLFLCTGIIIHRKFQVDEIDLHGCCRDLRVARLLFFVAAVGLCGVPPFLTYTGKGLLEEAANAAGYPWFTPVAIAASALTTAAILRAGARIYFGWGNIDALTRSAPMTGIEEEPETHGLRKKTPTTMWLPTAGLVILGLVSGLFLSPDLTASVSAAASLMANPSLSASVLAGNSQLPPAAPSHPGAHAALLSLATLLIAVVLAAAFLHPGKMRGRRVLNPIFPAINLLRQIHSGFVGDYIAWFALGLALLGGALGCLAG